MLLEAVREELGKTELDDFDLICHIAYDKAPLTKKERAENVKKDIISTNIPCSSKSIEALLDSMPMMVSGNKKIQKVLQLRNLLRSGLENSESIWWQEAYLKAVQELEKQNLLT